MIWLAALMAFAGPLQQDLCKKNSPRPSQVSYFYEDNPTYVSKDTSSWPINTPESQGLKSNVLDQGDTHLTSLPQPLSFLVLRHGTLVWEKYFHGSSQTDSNNVHSASKSLLGLLIGTAINEGYIQSIDQKVSEILPAFQSSPDKREITVRHLLTMSSGFKWTEDKTEYEIETTDNWVESILNLPMTSVAGTKFNYSTGNTHLLSALLTKASGLSTCDFARTRIFEPLGISFEHWGRDPQGYYSGGYNLYLKATELLKLGQLYLQNGQWDGQTVVPADWIQGAEQVATSEQPGKNYGHLLWIYNLNGHPTYKFWGYGGQFVYILPDYDMVVVTTADTKKDYTELDGEDFLNRFIFPAVEK